MTSLSILQQFFARWSAKSPKLFKIISWISLICTFITGLPLLLIQFRITLPDYLVEMQNKTIVVASIVGYVISKLTVDTPHATKQVLECEVENKK